MFGIQFAVYISNMKTKPIKEEKMYYDTQRIKNIERAKTMASIYLRTYGFKELRIGKLVPENKNDKEKIAIEIPSQVSPSGKMCDAAHDVGEGYTFIPICTLRKKK